MQALTRTEVRAIDQRALEEFAVPGVILMENAGRGAAELLVGLGARGPVAICCGKGNNGGDGLVMARHLDNRGIAVRVLLFARPEEVTGDAAINLEIVKRSGLPLLVQPDLAELAPADWIVDALFGTGLVGPVRPPFDAVIQAINASGRPVLAVDIPSGLDCDTGLSPGVTVKATQTATFVASKIGFANPEAAAYLGRVHVIEIGAPRACFPGNSGKSHLSRPVQ